MIKQYVEVHYFELSTRIMLSFYQLNSMLQVALGELIQQVRPSSFSTCSLVFSHSCYHVSVDHGSWLKHILSSH